MNRLRINITIALSFCIYTQSYGQGNQFDIQNNSYEQIFEYAKKENKHVLLFFHIDGCGGCIKMEKHVFSDSLVFEFLNKDFIFCNINAKKGEGIGINKIYRTQSYPTIIICDTSGEVVGKNIGFLSVDEFLRFCNRSINRNTSLPGMREIYHQGNRSADFLIEYCYQQNGANEVDSIAVNEYLATQKPMNLRTKDNIQFIYTFAITNTKSNIDIASPAFELLKTAPELFYNNYDTTQVNGRIVWIAAQNFQYAIKEKDFQKMQNCLTILSDHISENYYRVNDVNGVYKSIIFYTQNDHLGNSIIYQSLIGNEVKYNELLKSFEDKNSNDPEVLNSMAWTFVQNISDKQKIKDAEKWIKQAISINNNYAYNDTYAWLLFKEGNYKQALEIAELAISLAKIGDEDYSATTQLIEKIKTVME